jgi:hypothetical protein
LEPDVPPEASVPEAPVPFPWPLLQPSVASNPMMNAVAAAGPDRRVIIAVLLVRFVGTFTLLYCAQGVVPLEKGASQA